MPNIQEVYEMVTKQKPPEPGALERQQKRQVRAARNKKIGAFVVAAAIGVVAIVLILAIRPREDTTTPATQPPSVNPVDPSAVKVATDFTDAFAALDGGRAITYLTDNPYLDMNATTPEEVPVFTTLLAAMGYEQIPVEGCAVTSTSTAGTAVRCRFEWHNIRSDEVGRGPYPGYWDLTVRDGQIGAASLHWDIKRFGSQMWIPFRDWVAAYHPKDFEVMYVAGGADFALTEESIPLWDLRTREYVKEVNRGTTGQ